LAYIVQIDDVCIDQVSHAGNTLARLPLFIDIASPPKRPIKKASVRKEVQISAFLLRLELSDPH
jgi:hypothetical protein